MIMEYLFKSSAVIFILYICYKLFLQRETFFNANRWYFLIGLIVASLLPLIVIPIYIEYIPNATNGTFLVDSTIIPIEHRDTSFDYLQVLNWVYVIGVIFFLGKFCIELISLLNLFKKHNHSKIDTYNFIETHNDIPPFSFFNWIVYNPSKYSKEEVNHILNHEKVHAREFHSVDIILSQLACILFWFNPFIWLYKKELQQNLEFIADKKAQHYSECVKSYQLILLKSSIANHQFMLTNNFYNSQIKKRIIMLHKSKSKKLNAWKYLLILPLLGLFLMSFNTEKVYVEIKNPSEHNNAIYTEAANESNNYADHIEIEKKSDQLSEANSIKVTGQIKNSKSKAKPTTKTTIKKLKNAIGDISITLINKNTTDAELDNIKESLKKQGLAVKIKGVKRNNKNEITSIKIDVKSDNSNANYNISSDKAIDTIKIVYDENKNSISIGNASANQGENTFVFTTTDGNHKLHKSDNESHVIVISEDDHNDNDVKYIIKTDDKKGKRKTVKRSKTVIINSDEDKDVEVIIDEDKDNNSIVVVDDKEKTFWVTNADNKEEKIIILNDDDKEDNIFISGEKDPLYIIDGKEATRDDISELKASFIESVKVLKGEKAIEKYGKKGKDGVIIITTKKKN